MNDGRIAAVGHVPGVKNTVRTIDAEGMIVAPGIIDAHTHYDPQLTFDPWATSSCYHGVTTVLAGNCGFSIAPTREAARPCIKAMFAKVEGMEPEALDGVKWDFESFPEYLAARERGLGVNMACYVGHSSVRRFVMGADGSERHATPAEVDAMRALVREAMAAGAAGFSSSSVPTQVDGDNRPIPSRFAAREELVALCEEAGLAGGGSISYLPKSVIGGAVRSFRCCATTPSIARSISMRVRRSTQVFSRGVALAVSPDLLAGRRLAVTHPIGGVSKHELGRRTEAVTEDVMNKLLSR